MASADASSRKDVDARFLQDFGTFPLLRHYGYDGELLPEGVTGPGARPDPPLRFMDCLQRDGLPRALSTDHLRAALRSLLSGEVVQLHDHEQGEAQYVLRMALAGGFAEAAEALTPFAGAVDARCVVPYAASLGCTHLLDAALQRLKQLHGRWGMQRFCQDVMTSARSALSDNHFVREGDYLCSCHESCVDAMNGAARLFDDEHTARRSMFACKDFVPMNDPPHEQDPSAPSVRAVLEWALNTSEGQAGAPAYTHVPAHIVDALHSVSPNINAACNHFHGVLQVMAAAQLHAPLQALIKAHSARYRMKGHHYRLEEVLVAALQGDARADVAWYTSFDAGTFDTRIALPRLLCYMSSDDMDALPQGVVPTPPIPTYPAYRNSDLVGEMLSIAVAADNRGVLQWLLRTILPISALEHFKWRAVPTVQAAAVLRECAVLVASEQEVGGGPAVSLNAVMRALCAGIHSTHVLGALFGVDVSVPHSTPCASTGVLDLTQPLQQEDLQVLLSAVGRTPQQRAALLRDDTKASTREYEYGCLPGGKWSAALAHFCAVWANDCTGIAELHVDHARTIASQAFMVEHETHSPEHTVLSLRYALLLSTTRPEASCLRFGDTFRFTSHAEVQQACALRSDLIPPLFLWGDYERVVFVDLLRYQVAQRLDVPLGWYLQRKDDFLKLCISAHEWVLQRTQSALEPSQQQSATASSAVKDREAAIEELRYQLNYNQRRAMIERRFQRRLAQGFV